MDTETKLRITRLNFAGMAFLLEKLYKDPNIDQKVMEFTKNYLLPYYEQIKSQKGEAGVIQTFASAGFDAILDIPFVISEDKKKFKVKFPQEPYPSESDVENFKALFRVLCKVGLYIGEKVGAQTEYNSEDLSFEMKF